MKIHFSSSRGKTKTNFSSRISRDRDSCQGLLLVSVFNTECLLLRKPVCITTAASQEEQGGLQAAEFRLCNSVF